MESMPLHNSFFAAHLLTEGQVHLFVLVLLYVLAVAVDDDLDFLVQSDDALVSALLLLAYRFGNGKRN